MATDKILVERQYDGKWCGENECPQYHEETDDCGSYCGAFPADDVLGESGFKMDANAGHRTLRPLACLSTPSARELTPEMVDAVKEATRELAGLGLLSDDAMALALKLRAALAAYEEATK